MNAFISYSHKDNDYLERLHTHLANLKREGLISTWTDEAIRAGERFDNVISDSLEDSEIFIALLSPDYIGSEYCYEKEFERALELEKEGEISIIPVVLEPCDWRNTPFRKFKSLPTDGKPISQWSNQNSGFLNVALAIRNLLEINGRAHTQNDRKNDGSNKNLTIVLNEEFQFVESKAKITDILNTISEYRAQSIEYDLVFDIEGITEFVEEYNLLQNRDDLSDIELSRKNVLKDLLNSRFYYFKTTVYELLEYAINLVIDYSYLEYNTISTLEDLYFSTKKLVEQFGTNGVIKNSNTTGFDVFIHEHQWNFKINLDEEEVDRLKAIFNFEEKGFLLGFLGLDLFDLSRETIVKEVIPKQARNLTMDFFANRIQESDISIYMSLNKWRIGLA